MKNFTTTLIVSSSLAVISTPVLAVDVAETVEVAASADDVWAAIAGFCSIADWHPVIAKCEESEKDGEKHRTLTTGDGGVLLEKLDSMDEGNMSFTYSILEGPLPIENYQSTISVEKNSADKATVSWTSTFDAAGVTDDEARTLLEGIYRAGLDELGVQLGN